MSTHVTGNHAPSAKGQDQHGAVAHDDHGHASEGFGEQQLFDTAQGFIWAVMLALASMDVAGNRPTWLIIGYPLIVVILACENDTRWMKILESLASSLVPMFYIIGLFDPSFKGVNTGAPIMLILALYNGSYAIKHMANIWHSTTHILRSAGTKNDAHHG